MSGPRKIEDRRPSVPVEEPMTRRAPFEAHLKVAKPCPAKWDDMVGDDKSRHCDRCQKNVYNLELLEPEELVELIERTEGKFCGRLSAAPFRAAMHPKKVQAVQKPKD